MSLVIERVAANVSAKPRYDTMEGKDYIVVPAVIMVEGVLNGSNGAILYNAENMALNAWAWNYRPVVVYHPEKDGEYVFAASSSEMLTAHKVGVLMNTEFVEAAGKAGAKLISECWIDVEQVRLIDNRILEAIEQGRMLELSTGLASSPVEVSGSYDGVSYNAIAENIIPDHLAILPDQLGACSIEDGCGFLRVNTSKGEKLIHPKSEARRRGLTKFEEVWNSVHGDLSFTEIHNALWEALGNELGDKGISWNGYIEEVYDDYVVYAFDGSTYRRDYTLKKKKVKLKNTSEEVVRVIEYEPVANTNKPEDVMSTAIMVDALIANDQTDWVEDDRNFLSQLGEAQLVKIEGKKPAEKEGEEGKEKLEANAKPCCPPNANKVDEVIPPVVPAKSKTSQEFINELPTDVQDVLQEGLVARAGQRVGLINSIKANSANTFTDDQLEGMITQQLTAVAALAGPSEAEGQIVDYAALGGGYIATVNAEPEEALLLPAWE